MYKGINASLKKKAALTGSIHGQRNDKQNKDK